MKFIFLALALIPVFYSTAAIAKQATFCKTGPMLLEQAHGTTFTRDATEFTCGNGLKATVPELYKQGWQVISLNIVVTDISMTRSFTSILIEKDN